jgi:hypothetical protein
MKFDLMIISRIFYSKLLVMGHSDGKNQFLHFLGLFYVVHTMSIFGISVDGEKSVGDKIKSFMTNFKILDVHLQQGSQTQTGLRATLGVVKSPRAA